MAEKNVNDEVVGLVIDSMPEPSSAAEEILASELEPEPEPEPETKSAEKIPVPPVNWKSDENGYVSADAVEAETTTASQPAMVDANGVAFDPNFHAVDSQGNPSKTKGGKWRKKRGVTGGPVPTVDINAIMTASIAIVSAVEMIGFALGGDEWKPEQNEHELMVGAWRDYFLATGAITLPPWLGVVIATGAYAAPRFSRPKTMSRLEAIFYWVRRKIPW